MDDWWPAVNEAVLAHLQRVYVTPLRLEAAFDNEEECAMWLQAEFPDMLDEDVLDAVAQLSLWKESMARP